MKKKIVVSAINLYKGGPLTVLRDCLEYLNDKLSADHEIIALVNSNVFALPNITFYEFPASRRSWLIRLYYEFSHFKRFSRKIKPYLWLSLHDITPNVTAAKLAVYCHNPAPFYRLRIRDFWFEPRFALFNFFYRYLYRLNIKKNDFVIVQQDWLRKRFKAMYKIDKVIVAKPQVTSTLDMVRPQLNDLTQVKSKEGFIFFYPSFARCFKNFESICEATKLLIASGLNGFALYLTISGRENRYARYIYKKYGMINNIRFIGEQSRATVFEYYRKTDCLIFPSKLETWGLPVSEFKQFNKPILIADAEYAAETIGAYEKVKYFDPDDHGELAEKMKEVMAGQMKYDRSHLKVIESPYADTWRELFDLLLGGEDES